MRVHGVLEQGSDKFGSWHHGRPWLSSARLLLCNAALRAVCAPAFTKYGGQAETASGLSHEQKRQGIGPVALKLWPST